MRKPPAQDARLDSRNRRIGDIRQPKGKTIHLNGNDLDRFEFLHRHGDLPRPFIHEYTIETNRDLWSTQTRLTDLYNEAPGYLGRPAQQKRIPERYNKFKIYRTDPPALDELKRAGRFHENTPKSSNSWEHDFLRSCYTASIELACRKQPDEYAYIHHDTIINNVIEKTGQYPTFESCGDTFSSDVFFGIHYLKQNVVKLFGVEIDMMTETITSTKKKLRTKTITQSLAQYRDFIKTGRYKKVFQFTGGFFLINITVNHTHAHNMMKAAKDEPFFLFNWVPGFEYYITPPTPMHWLFTEPYARPGKQPEFSLAVA